MPGPTDPNSIQLSFYTDTAAIDKAGRAVDGFRDNVTRLDAAMGRSAAGTRNWSLVAFQAGQAVQDMSYGFHGAINNLSFMASMLGAGGAFGIGLQVGLTGVMLLTQNWERLTRAFQGSNAIPQIGGEFERLNATLAETNKRLDELKSKGTLTNAELTEFTALADIRGIREKRAESARAYQAAETMRTPDEDNAARVVAAAVKQLGGLKALMGMAEARNGGPFDEIQREGWRNMFNAAMGGDRSQADFLARLPGFEAFRDALQGATDRSRAGQFVGPAEDPLEREKRLANERLVEQLNEQGRAYQRLTDAIIHEERERRRELGRQQARAMQERGHALSERADADAASLVGATGAAGALAQAANELMFSGGRRRGSMTQSEKQRAMLRYMRQGMSRQEALKRVHEDEQAAMQTAGFDALGAARSAFEADLIASGMAPDEARRAANVAAQDVLSGTDAAERNTDATLRLTTAVERLERNGIPLRLARRGRN